VIGVTFIKDLKGWIAMFQNRLNHKWMLFVFASLAVAFSASTASAVGVDEPDPDDDAAITADDAAAIGVGERGPRGRRGFGRDRSGEDGPRERRRPGAMLWNRMTDEEKEEVKAFVAEYYPEVSEALESSDEDGGRPRMDRKNARMLPEILRMHQLSIDDPQMFEIKMAEQKSRFQLRQLVREYRQADDESTKEELSAKIRPLVVAAFDAQQSRMEQEVTRLEKRLEGLRRHIAKRADNRDEEIEQAFNDVLDGKAPKDERFDRESRRRGPGRGFRGPRGPEGAPGAPEDEEPDMDDEGEE